MRARNKGARMRFFAFVLPLALASCAGGLPDLGFFVAQEANSALLPFIAVVPVGQDRTRDPVLLFPRLQTSLAPDASKVLVYNTHLPRSALGNQDFSFADSCRTTVAERSCTGYENLITLKSFGREGDQWIARLTISDESGTENDLEREQKRKRFSISFDSVDRETFKAQVFQHEGVAFERYMRVDSFNHYCELLFQQNCETTLREMAAKP